MGDGEYRLRLAADAAAAGMTDLERRVVDAAVASMEAMGAVEQLRGDDRAVWGELFRAEEALGEAVQMSTAGGRTAEGVVPGQVRL